MGLLDAVGSALGAAADFAKEATVAVVGSAANVIGDLTSDDRNSSDDDDSSSSSDDDE